MTPELIDQWARKAGAVAMVSSAGGGMQYLADALDFTRFAERVRAYALEEAAKACEAEGKGAVAHKAYQMAAGAAACYAAIRSLIDKPL